MKKISCIFGIENNHADWIPTAHAGNVFPCTCYIQELAQQQMHSWDQRGQLPSGHMEWTQRREPCPAAPQAPQVCPQRDRGGGLAILFHLTL